jgi:hypothetical protein
VGMINIGHDQPETGFYLRKLRLIMDSSGQTFEPEHEHPMAEPSKANAESLPAE